MLTGVNDSLCPVISCETSHRVGHLPEQGTGQAIVEAPRSCDRLLSFFSHANSQGRVPDVLMVLLMDWSIPLSPEAWRRTYGVRQLKPSVHQDRHEPL